MYKSWFRFLVVVSVLSITLMASQPVLADEPIPPIMPSERCVGGRCRSHPYPDGKPSFPDLFHKELGTQALGMPYMEIYPLENEIRFWEFTWGGNISLEIYDSPGGTLLFSDTFENAIAYYLNFDLQIGQYISATDITLAQNVTAVVGNVTLLDIDTDTDVFTGKADPLANLGLAFCHTNGCENISVSADGDGNWSGLFSNTDVVPFGWYGAYVADFPNVTVSTFPYFRAEVAWDWVNFLDYSMLNTITWEVKDSPAGSILFGPETFTFEGNWLSGKSTNSDIQAGYYVYSKDDDTGIIKDHIILNGSIDNVDFVTDEIAGTAPANSYLEVAVTDWSTYWDAIYTQADGSGNWSVDFTGTRDIDASAYVEVSIADNDNDYTFLFWEPPYMEINAHYFSNFNAFTPDNKINISLYEDITKSKLLWSGQIDTNSDGFGQMYFTDFGCIMIQDGHYIEAYDVGSGITKGLEFTSVGVTDANEAAATAAGFGPPNTWLRTFTNDQNGWREEWVLADGSGNWFVDYGLGGSTTIESLVVIDNVDSDHDTSHSARNKVWYAGIGGNSTTNNIRLYWDGAYYNACYGQDINLVMAYSGDADLGTFLDSFEIDLTIDGVPQFGSYPEANTYFTYPPLGEGYSWDGSALVARYFGNYFYPTQTLSAGEHTIHAVATYWDDGLGSRELAYDATFTINVMPSAAPAGLSGFNGSIEIIADQPIVAISRPHIGKEIMAYNGASEGANTVYLPMLFNNTWGSYTSTFTVENTSVDPATYTITFKDALTGNTTCEISSEVLPRHGVKTYDVTNLSGCTGGTVGSMPAGWYGGATISSDQPVTAVGRPNVNGTDAVTYNGVSGGAGTVYLPMLFKDIWGYQAAFYVQNLHGSSDASLSIEFYDNQGNHTCTYADPIPVGPSVTRGYWMGNITIANCTGGVGFPADGWAGSAVITSTGSDNIVAIGRPHMGAEVAAYNGFTSAGTTNYLPMLFRGMWGYNAAVYIQNIAPDPTSIVITFYDTAGNEVCIYTDPSTLGQNATRGYWLPNINCNDGRNFPAGGWAGSAKIVSSQEVIAVGRPHLSDNQVVVYNGFTGGTNSVFTPFNFRAWSGNETALYIQNLGLTDATATIRLYDEESGFFCQMEKVVTPGSAGAVWLAALNNSVCVPTN